MMRGVESITVQKIVGHKKLQTTMKYTRLKEDRKAKQMWDAWDKFGSRNRSKSFFSRQYPDSIYFRFLAFE